MLRHARCNLVGAILNRQQTTPIRNLFPRWIISLMLLGLMAISNAQGAAPSDDHQQKSAADDQEDKARTNLSFSIVRPSQRAAWQQHLSLGPGDVLTFNLYGQPELNRPEVAIGPDGRVSYLEAQDVLATGLSIDELREKIDEELGKYRRAPRTIVTPVAFHSKKYYMLGKVTTKGVFTLDRPLTVLEAIARAHGLENALIDRNMVSLTDFQHSFLARGGKRISLNFENLFQRGDLSQNIAIEPGDYIYFAAGDINEVYVVGEVRLPGPVTFTPDLTIIGAITGRGGYTDRAYKTRVLVVRGPLDKPLTYAVNTHAILDAKATDFKLEPRDIIFVNSRPFIKVEEAADLAMTAFIQSVITSAVGVNVVKTVQ
jgi:protein involved in polysaccharide export with SLBB domain